MAKTTAKISNKKVNLSTNSITKSCHKENVISKKKYKNRKLVKNRRQTLKHNLKGQCEDELPVLFKVSKFPPTSQTCRRNITKNTNNLFLPLQDANIIEAKIMEKFYELCRGCPNASKYKVLSGIVMTINKNFQNSIVVSVATGTKCVNGGNICYNGSVLNDSHAEIIAKRGLMKFLYAQLKFHFENDLKKQSIFQRNGNNLQKPYKLKPNINFHLYINTAPCGDARVFTFNQTNIFNNTGYGQLRMKVEGQMGTYPVGMSYLSQTWDGVAFGDPLHTMSCSDKIALWNVVGIQGALLSQFIEPIYFYSVILGSMFNANHIYRAICGRIEDNLGLLPKPYRLNRPLLGQTSNRFRRSLKIAPNIGINWTFGDTNIEIISLPSGRTIKNDTSILSKQLFFLKYSYLCNNLPNENIPNYKRCSYAEAKQNAKSYQQCKGEVIKAFYMANLGTWVKKPIEQNQFVLNWY